MGDRTLSGYKYFKLTSKSDAVLKAFTAGIFGVQLEFEVRVLKEEEYDRLQGRDSSAFLAEEVVKGDPNSKNLLDRYDRIRRTIFLRGMKVFAEDLIHEVLHAYYPYLKEEEIKQAEAVVAYALQCYTKLYDSQVHRDFFLELCRANDQLRKWSGLPKFNFGHIYRYEQRLLSEDP